MTELLAPAGSPEALDAAIGEGADAVYLGLKDFNARMRSTNFTYPQFERVLKTLHRMGKKIYVTVNTVFEQREADRVYQLLKYLAELGPDGIMVQDFGIVTMARESFPQLKLFASTQMNVASARGINFLSRHGFSRVVLSRELSLDEIKEIRANTNMELEVFIHGALCVSVSGICLFSSYLGGKSANRGMCTQACRRFYTAQEGYTESDGAYYFSPSDLQLIDHIPELAGAGINSFKIEGRMKSADYVGKVVSAYRLVIDNLNADAETQKEAMEEAKSILKNDFARAKTAYLLNGMNTGKDKTFPWLNPNQSGGTGIPLGTIQRVRGQGEKYSGLLEGGSVKPGIGDSIRLHSADDSDRVSFKIKFTEDAANNSHWVSIPEGYKKGDEVYLIQTKSMIKHYEPVLSKGRDHGGRYPGRERAAPPTQTTNNKEQISNNKYQRAKNNSFDVKRDGIYVMVSSIEDMYVLQSLRPEKVILTLNRKVIKKLCQKDLLPFKPGEIILSLDPFFPQSIDEELTKALDELMELGFAGFIINNLGHFPLVKNSGAAVIAGPWLYSFNAWAWNFLARSGAEYCISPLENNRQNAERTFQIERSNPREKNFPGIRSKVFLTVLSQPSLFRMRPDFGRVYGFDFFSDNRNEVFRLSSSEEGSLVYPADYFSIVDKIPFLREAGFSRFILDLSSAPVKKTAYKDLMEVVKNSTPLPGSNRFNWKNGFFREKA